MSRLKQGKFVPKNPQKYRGDVNNIQYRSGWELNVMKYLDRTPGVIEWSSEETIVPYFDPIKNRHRRYFPDLYVKVETKSGEIKESLWEIKPKKQTKPPVPGKRKTSRFIHDVLTYGTNEAKFEAAKKYCEGKGWSFNIITEDHIFGKRTK